MPPTLEEVGPGNDSIDMSPHAAGSLGDSSSSAKPTSADTLQDNPRQSLLSVQTIPTAAAGNASAPAPTTAPAAAEAVTSIQNGAPFVNTTSPATATTAPSARPTPTIGVNGVSRPASGSTTLLSPGNTSLIPAEGPAAGGAAVSPAMVNGGTQRHGLKGTAGSRADDLVGARAARRSIVSHQSGRTVMFDTDSGGTAADGANRSRQHLGSGSAGHLGFRLGDPFACELSPKSVGGQGGFDNGDSASRRNTIKRRLSTTFLLGDQGNGKNQDQAVEDSKREREADVVKIRNLLHADKNDGKRLFLPEDQWRWFFDSVILIISMYYAMTVPTAIMWPAIFDTLGVAIVECVLTAVLIADVYVNMHTMVMRDGILQNRKSLIHAVYLRTWACVDLLSCVPADLIVYAATGSAAYFSYTRIPRLVKLLKIHKLFGETIPESITEMHVWWIYQCVPIVKGLLWTAIALHWLSLIRVWLVWDDADGGTGQRGYITAAYWVTCTVTTVGYGDIVVASDGQRVYAIILSIGGTVLNGFVIGSLIRLLTQSDIGSERNDRMRETLAVLRYFKVPKILTHEALSYRHYQLQNMINADLPCVLDGFPTQLADDITVYVKLKFINLVPMFEHASDPCKIEMAKSLDIRVAQMQTVLCEVNDPLDELYFIAHGFVELVTHGDEGTYSSVLRKGDFFGEVSLLLGRSNCMVHAMTYCEMYTLSKASFLGIIEDYPDFGAIIRQKLDEMERALHHPHPGCVQVFDDAAGGGVNGIVRHVPDSNVPHIAVAGHDEDIEEMGSMVFSKLEGGGGGAGAADGALVDGSPLREAASPPPPASQPCPLSAEARSHRSSDSLGAASQENVSDAGSNGGEEAGEDLDMSEIIGIAGVDRGASPRSRRMSTSAVTGAGPRGRHRRAEHRQSTVRASPRTAPEGDAQGGEAAPPYPPLHINSSGGVLDTIRSRDSGGGVSVDVSVDSPTASDRGGGGGRSSHGSCGSAVWEMRRAGEALNKIEARRGERRANAAAVGSASPRMIHRVNRLSNDAMITPSTVGMTSTTPAGHYMYGSGPMSVPVTPRGGAHYRGVGSITASAVSVADRRRRNSEVPMPPGGARGSLPPMQMQGFAALGLGAAAPPDAQSAPRHSVTVDQLNQRLDRFQDQILSVLRDQFLRQNVLIETLVARQQMAHGAQGGAADSAAAGAGGDAAACNAALGGSLSQPRVSGTNASNGVVSPFWAHVADAGSPGPSRPVGANEGSEDALSAC